MCKFCLWITRGKNDNQLLSAGQTKTFIAVIGLFVIFFDASIILVKLFVCMHGCGTAHFILIAISVNLLWFDSWTCHSSKS